MTLVVATDEPLAPLTTLELGGPARFFVEAHEETTLIEALAWADTRGVPVLVIGGGSNVVIADAGFDGLVVRVATRGVRWQAEGDRVLVEAQAGEPWDALVAASVSRGVAGLECLSGIPGLVGATPIQNVGAYGQEVAETIRVVRLFDRRAKRIVELPAAACAFSYRNSAFRRDPNGQVVLSVSFALRPGGAPAVRYPELERAVAEMDAVAPTLDQIRDTVLALRRRKSMIVDPRDDNRRSAGSFFTNPIVTDPEAERVIAQALAEGMVTDRAGVPCFVAGPGRKKLAAAWLIERSGIGKGTRRGAVGVSSRHCLALVHHGGGSAAQLMALAREIRDAVLARFAIRLSPEPILVGLQWADSAKSSSQ